MSVKCGSCGKDIDTDYEGIICYGCGKELCINCQEDKCPLCGEAETKGASVISREYIYGLICTAIGFALGLFASGLSWLFHELLNF